LLPISVGSDTCIADTTVIATKVAATRPRCDENRRRSGHVNRHGDRTAGELGSNRGAAVLTGSGKLRSCSHETPRPPCEDQQPIAGTLGRSFQTDTTPGVNLIAQPIVYGWFCELRWLRVQKHLACHCEGAVRYHWAIFWVNRAQKA
jgi:hypothetical protein